MGQVFWKYADAGVAYLHRCIAFTRDQRKRDGPLVGRIFESVVQQGDKCLLELVGIAVDLRRCDMLKHKARPMGRLLASFTLSRTPVLAKNLQQQAIQVNQLCLSVTILIAIDFGWLDGICVGKCEQVAHETSHAVGLGASIGQCSLRLGGRKIGSFGEQIKIAADGGDRSAQFMGGVGDKTLLALVGFL